MHHCAWVHDSIVGFARLGGMTVRPPSFAPSSLLLVHCWSGRVVLVRGGWGWIALGGAGSGRPGPACHGSEGAGVHGDKAGHSMVAWPAKRSLVTAAGQPERCCPALAAAWAPERRWGWWPTSLTCWRGAWTSMPRSRSVAMQAGGGLKPVQWLLTEGHSLRRQAPCLGARPFFPPPQPLSSSKS